MASTQTKLFCITVDLQRYHSEKQTWTTYLVDCFQIGDNLTARWSTSDTHAMLLDYADAVEYQLKIREFYPHAVVKITEYTDEILPGV